MRERAGTWWLRSAALLALVTQTRWGHAAPQAPEPEMLQELERVKRVLAPLCAPRCGRVELVREDEQVAAAHVDRLTDPEGRAYSRIAYRRSGVAVWELALGDVGRLHVLAHEFGHHLDLERVRPRWRPEDPWPGELVADVTTGCALAQARVPPAVLLRYRALGVEDEHTYRVDAASHPPASWWTAAVSAGYHACAARRDIGYVLLLQQTRPQWQRRRPHALASSAGALISGPLRYRRLAPGPDRIRQCYRAGFAPPGANSL